MSVTAGDGNDRVYRKRPVKVRARLHTGTSPIYIETLEGRMEAQPGDWIVTGINGERYPVKPEIFEATYEPVTRRRS